MKVAGVLAWYKAQQFNPGWGSLWINPFFLIRRDLYRALSGMAQRIRGGAMLDFGCGAKPYRHLFEVDEYIGLDMENPGHSHRTEEVDVYYDGRNIPFPEHRFDAVLASEVMEHVFEPQLILAELHRVMKPGALALFTVPFAWNEHEMPHDYARYSQGGFEALLRSSGFEIVQSVKTNRFTRTWFQMGILGWYQLWQTPNKYANILLSIPLLGPLNITAWFLSELMPGSASWYCNTVVLARTPGSVLPGSVLPGPVSPGSMPPGSPTYAV